MSFRLLAAALAVCLIPLTSLSQDKKPDEKKPADPKVVEEENPFKNVKVDDYVKYRVKASVGPVTIDGIATQTVTSKTDKEAIVKVTSNVGGMETPAQEIKQDLTKPYDPTKAGVGALPAGTDATVEKLKEGKEKIKIGDKEYDTTWTTYKVKAKSGGMEIEADVKVWTAKDVIMGMVKMDASLEISKMKMELKLELAESGNKKP